MEDPSFRVLHTCNEGNLFSWKSVNTLSMNCLHYWEEGKVVRGMYIDDTLEPYEPLRRRPVSSNSCFVCRTNVRTHLPTQVI